MEINAMLDKMRKAGKMQDVKEKGNIGEDAVFEICAQRTSMKSLLYNSVLYPYQTSRAGQVYVGNIKWENNDFREYTDSSIDDEIDVLYVTPYRIFPIEVKSYHVYRIDIYDHWVSKGNTPVDKSPVAQAEKHARHLYHALFDVIPDGNPAYIVPMVCFVDRCTIRDDRSQHFKDYIPVCVLNNLNATLDKYNTPLEYNISLPEVEHKVKNVARQIKKENN